MMTLISEYIRNRRGSLGMRQADLAEKVGISAQYLSDIENGNRAVGTAQRSDLIERFAIALDVDADILYFCSGLLAPDMWMQSYDNEKIIDAFAAMRNALRGVSTP